MDDLELYQSRLRDSRKIAKSKLVDVKIKTFKRALASSYNSEVVSIDSNEFEALITGIPTSPQISKKNFATLLDNECGTGDELYWPANDSYWLITEHDNTEGAIFQGSIQESLYELKWKDPVLDTIYTARACAKGPDETTIGDGVKNAIFFDVLTDSLYLIVSSKVAGSQFLERYFELMLDGKKWRIEVVNAITKSNLLYMQLMESPINRDKDTEDIVGGKEETIFTMNTSLDDIATINLNSEVNFQPILLRNGKVIEKGETMIRTMNCTHNENRISFNQIGRSSITVNFKDYNKIFRIEIDVVEENAEDVIIEKIVGSSSIKTLSTHTFTAIETTNGKQRSEVGVWGLGEDDFFNIVEISDNTITLKAKNKTGVATITYTNGDVEITKEIKIVPLFGGS